MQKTVYQTPELRDANDNIIQQGAFGKNTALSNSTNDGWIDYVMNNLEALHDVVGETSPTLDANGHVVEPANLAIGDEDGNRIKESYLKLSGGKVTGVASFRTDLRMLDNQDNRWGGLYVPGTTSSVQYLSLYGGTRATGDARLNLYNFGNGKFELTGYSTDGANAYTLTHDNNGNLKWRGNTLAYANNYLPLSGGTLTGNPCIIKMNDDVHLLQIAGGNTDSGYNGGARLSLYGKGHSETGAFRMMVYDDTNGRKELIGRPNGTLTWGGLDISPQACSESQSSQDTTLPSGTPKTVHSFTLTKGTWLLLGRGYFASNANGYRTLWFSSTDNGSSISSQARTNVNPQSGAACWTQVMAIRSISTTTTLYLVASQNSGSSLNASGGVVMFRLSNKA